MYRRRIQDLFGVQWRDLPALWYGLARCPAQGAENTCSDPLAPRSARCASLARIVGERHSLLRGWRHAPVPSLSERLL